MTSTKPGHNWQRTSPIAIVFFLFKTARQFVSSGLPAIALILAAYTSSSDSNQSLIQMGLLVAIVLGVVGSVLSWLRFRYCIVDDRVLLRSGVFHREELSVEFNRIQNISIREPFYARPFKLALFSIDTAGSGKEEIVLGGIKKDVAVELRTTILAKAGPAADPEDEQHDRLDESNNLLERSTKDIAIYGLTINFSFWFLIAIGAIFSADDFSEKTIRWLARKIQIQDLMAIAQNDGNFISLGLITLGIGLALFLLLPLVSVIGALIRHYGYRLDVEGETYRKTSGLLSRHDESLKRHKIQALVLKQNFVALWFNRTNIQLKVASAGSGVEPGQIPGVSKRTFLVPTLHPAEMETLIPEFLPGCEIEKVEFSKINLYRYARVVLGLAVLPPVLLLTVIFSVLISWKFIVVAPVILGIAWLLVHQRWKKLAYAVVGEYGFVRSGFIGTKTTVFPLFKVQKVDIRQTPGQRRKGFAHLTIHLASHSLTIPHMAVKHAIAMRDLILYYVESTNRRWY